MRFFLLEDSEGYIWAGGQPGTVSLNRLERKTGRLDRSFVPRQGDSTTINLGAITAGLEDPQGYLWFGGGRGINRLDKTTGLFTHYVPFPKALNLSSGNFVESMIRDDEGYIWAGTWYKGLCRLDPRTGEFQCFEHDPTDLHSLSNNSVFALYIDSKNRFWIGTQHGLNLLDRTTGHFTRYFVKHGLIGDDIMGILEDEQGRLWISTTKGISRFDPETETFQNFTREHGLQGNAFSLFSAFKSPLSGEFFFAGENGFNIFHPDDMRIDTVAPQVVISSFTRYNLEEGKPTVDDFIEDKEKIILTHLDNVLVFELAALNFRGTSKNQYKYQLEGFSDLWYDLGNKREFTFTDLDPGNYTLRVMAANGDNIWNPIPTELAIKVLPPWWWNTWSQILYTLVLGLSLYSLYRWRTSDLKKRQKELEQTVKERTAEVVAQKDLITIEKDRSEALLLNILPASVAKELMATGSTKPVRFEEVSILFADFKGFTNIVASIPAKTLVHELNDIFQHFDDIAANESLEKIKTVGDAYLAVSGLPKEDPNHALECVTAAKHMIEYLNKRNEKSGVKWKARIGIHSGPITAGVVGKNKFTYDLFGDTVNIASRIETSSEEGRINVSAFTYDLIKEKFPCEYRGKINAKGKGEIDMYFVN